MPSKILRSLILLSLVLSALARAAHAGAQTPKSRLGRPPPVEAVPEPLPELADEEWSRRAWQLEASTGPALGLCPVSDAQCTSELGLAFAAQVQSRPVPLFSWGPFFTRMDHQQRFTSPQWTLRQRTTAWALGLAGRLWLQDRGRIDPYVQVSAGLGNALRLGEFEERQERNSPSSGGHRNETVPLYGVAAGISVQVTSELRVGTELGWSHWLFSEWERCPVLSGVCVNPPLRAYDPHNGVLTLSLSVGLSFGERL